MGPSTSLLMTQLACDVLHSLAEQILNVTQHTDINLRELGIIDLDNPSITENAKCRQ